MKFKLTSIFIDGLEEIVNSTFNLETGEIGDAFIIPSNLTKGDTFLEKTEGNITITGVNQKNMLV